MGVIKIGKKYTLGALLIFGAIFFLLTVVLPSTVFGQTPDFVPLTGIPGVETTGSTGLVTYLNALYILAISLGALFGVVRIAVAGVQYSASGDNASARSKAKNDILGALFGLAILLATYIVLYTINPDLTRLDILRNAEPSAPAASTGSGDSTVVIDPDIISGSVDSEPATSGTTRDPNAITCPSGQIKFRYQNGTIGCGEGHGSRLTTSVEDLVAAQNDCKAAEGDWGIKSIVGVGQKPQFVCSW